MNLNLLQKCSLPLFAHAQVTTSDEGKNQSHHEGYFLDTLLNTFMLGKISEPPLPPQQSYKTLVPVSLERKLERLTEITHGHLGSLRRDFGLKVHLL